MADQTVQQGTYWRPAWNRTYCGEWDNNVLHYEMCCNSINQTRDDRVFYQNWYEPAQRKINARNTERHHKMRSDADKRRAYSASP